MLFFAVRANDEDCIDLLLEYGAKVDLDPIRALNITILVGNVDVFDQLIEHGADIHAVPDEYAFPAAMACALTDYRFVTRLCQLGLDASVFFECPYGDGEHPPEVQVVGEKPLPWCYLIEKQRNKQIADWLMPYIAKFTNYKVRLCSKLSVLVSDEARSQLFLAQNTMPTLKHQARLKGKC